MAVKFYSGASGTGSEFKIAVGRLDSASGGETSMSATSEPSQVRVYNTGKSNGDLIDFTYATGTVSFTSYTAVTGDKIIAIAGDKELFSDDYVIGNSSTGSEREAEQLFYVNVSGSDEDNCILSFEDLVAAEGAATTWFTLTTTGDGSTGDYSGKTPGASLDLGDLADGSDQLVYAKLAVPESTAKQNARDVLIKFNSLSGATN